jgi:hypothetical protein
MTLKLILLVIIIRMLILSSQKKKIHNFSDGFSTSNKELKGLIKILM